MRGVLPYISPTSPYIPLYLPDISCCRRLDEGRAAAAAHRRLHLRARTEQRGRRPGLARLRGHRESEAVCGGARCEQELDRLGEPLAPQRRPPD